MRLYTFPKGLNEHKISLFSSGTSTLEKNSDNNTGDFKPGTNAYQVERGASYIATHGDPHSSGGMRMAYNTSIGNHYWMCCICGANKFSNPSNVNYSPLYDGIFKGIKFDWKKYDNTGNDSKYRYRLLKIGLVYRSGSTSTALKDLPTDSSDLFKFKRYTQTGSSTLQLSSPLSHVIGIYFQLETEGGGASKASGSYIDIKNLTYISSSSKEAILSPKEKYSSMSAPSGQRKIWTY